ncbi:MAG: bifunctional lysylphosphatidylglycerol flippase/synthetase MprF [Chromatiales bacterium]|nr:bifunctional lysylphosphatidylglycerol flippase/synthetase MprF [Chromatiales bacterium]
MLGVFILVVLLLDRELRAYHLRDVLAAARAIAPDALWAAVGFTALSYATLTLFDVLGLRYAGKPLPYSRTAPTALIAYAFAHSFSLAALTGAAIRYRLYAPSGLTAVDVARVSAFTSVTTGLGISLLGGLALLLAPTVTGSFLRLHAGWALAAGVLVLAGILAYIAWGAFARRATEFWNWRIEPPGGRLVGLQLMVGLADLAFSAAALWVLLPGPATVSFAAFCGAYAAAIVVSLISHVPGGLGVLESVLMLTIPHGDPAGMLGALLVYRLIYYLLPLLAATLLFAGQELAGQIPRQGRKLAQATGWLQQGTPQILGSLVFLAGALLLVSGATPGIDSRLATLRDVLPLPILETSHLAGSVIGLGLLVLARALFERVNAAYHVTVALLLAGAAASLLKGLDYEEALVLGLILFALWLGRRQFHRRASLWDERFSPGWTVNLLVVIGTAAWIGFLTHKQVPYSNDLWWTFASDADAPRMLRATLLVSLLAAVVLLSSLLRPAQPEPVLPSAADLERARRVIAASPVAGASVALTGDKHLLFAGGDRAFLMYRITGRSWIALGDPVGPRECWEELAWRFRELVDEHGGRTVFYEVSGDGLPLYLDLGLTLTKLGEEARVSLADFSLEGRGRAELRSARRRAERDGVTFEIVMPPGVPAVMPELEKISAQWLEEKSVEEKGFSLGFFSPGYLANFPLALVRRQGTPVAFANLWASGGREELSVDLMRFGADAPHGAMDFLFTELLIWGQAQGYAWFNLGMAPLSGLEEHPLAPAWHRVGNLVFRYGEHFYNFSGLRRYKAKFDPVWQPRYLASPGGLALPRVLLDVSTLISGGVRGIWSRPSA